MINVCELQYNKNDLEPYISNNTVEFHYEKHHKGYLNNLLNFIKDTDYQNKNLEEIIKISYQKLNSSNNKQEIAIFNNAAQVWNHDCFWNSMKKVNNINDVNSIEKNILSQIEKDFTSFAKFKEEFVNLAISQFGSGWCWLVWNKNEKKLSITKTANAETPLTNNNLVTLFVVDVWEHSYYLDYQNRRVDYVKNFIDYLVNFENLHQKCI